jgi:hypothetical protein
MTSDRAIAQQTQEKFQFYFLALTFTLLAATIQTSKFGRSTVEDILELGGWLGLLTSGLVGLWKMEWDAVIRVQLAKRDECSNAISSLQQQMQQGLQQVFVLETGQMQDVTARIANYQEAVNALNTQIKGLEKKDAIKYNVSKYAFLLGLVVLMASRSAAAIAELMGYVLL